MRKKWRIPLKILAAVCIFAVLLTLAQTVLNQPDTRIYQIVKGFYAEPAGSLDAVYVGASTVQAFWQAPLAWKSHGIKVYPYTIPGMPVRAEKYIIEEARKTQPDALYIICLNSVKTGGILDATRLHRLADYMPFSGTKVRMINDLCERGGIAPLDRLEYYFPIIRFHSTWSTAESSDFLRPLNHLKAGQTYSTFMGGITDLSDSFGETDTVIQLSDDMEDAVQDILSYARETQLRAMFVIVPQGTESNRVVMRMNRAEQIVEEAGYDCVNLFRGMEELGIDPAVDFYNRNHTNVHGSIKYTEYFAQYLQEHYGFTDKRGQAGTEDWDRAAEDYENLLKPVVLDIELEHAARDIHMPAPQNLEIVPAENGLQLSWTQVDGADGYAVYRRRPRATNGDEFWKRIAEVPGGDITYTDTSVGVHILYEYKLVPYRMEDGNPVYGSFDYVGLEVTSTLPGVRITSAERTGNAVRLTWEPVSGATGYMVLRSDGDKPWAILRSVDKTDFKDSDVGPDTDYRYQIRAYYQRGGNPRVDGYWDEASGLLLPAVNEDGKVVD